MEGRGDGGKMRRKEGEMEGRYIQTDPNLQPLKFLLEFLIQVLILSTIGV